MLLQEYFVGSLLFCPSVHKVHNTLNVGLLQISSNFMYTENEMKTGNGEKFDFGGQRLRSITLNRFRCFRMQ